MSRIPKNDIVFIGMNKYAQQEAQALREQGADVKVVSDAPKNDTIKVGRTTYDLTDRAQVDQFVDTLGLKDPAQKAKIADIIKNAGPDAKDELAQLAQVWAKGENGGKVPGRVVLSGHSNGSTLWGKETDKNGKTIFENGKIIRDEFIALAKAMPKAAGQVEDLALSACYCGGEDMLKAWKEGFPNAKTVLAYNGKSPGGSWEQGSPAHLKRWEQFTRGDKNALSPDQFKDLYKGGNVATWSVKHGYLQPGQEKPEVVKARIDAFKRDRADFLSGKTVDPTRLNKYYDDLQELVGRSSTDPALKTELGKEIDVMLRLRHHTGVNNKFQAMFKDELGAGFKAAGMTAPDFSKLSRKETVAQIAAFESAVAKMSPPTKEATEALRLLKGLRDYDKAVIPDNWVG